jgi:hypothetical protein
VGGVVGGGVGAAAVLGEVRDLAICLIRRVS